MFPLFPLSTLADPYLFPWSTLADNQKKGNVIVTRVFFKLLFTCSGPCNTGDHKFQILKKIEVKTP